MDGTPDVISIITNKKLFVEDEDLPAASVQHKKNQYLENLLDIKIEKTVEVEKWEKKVFAEELLEARREEYQTCIIKLLDEHETKIKQQMQEQE